MRSISTDRSVINSSVGSTTINPILYYTEDSLASEISRLSELNAEIADNSAKRTEFIANAVQATQQVTSIVGSDESFHTLLFSALTKVLKNPSANEISFVDTLCEGIFSQPVIESVAASKTAEFIVQALQKAIFYTKEGMDNPKRFESAYKLLFLTSQYLEKAVEYNIPIPTEVDKKILELWQKLKKDYPDQGIYLIDTEDSNEGGILCEAINLVGLSRNHIFVPELLFFAKELTQTEFICEERDLEDSYFAELRTDCFITLSLCNSAIGSIIEFWQSTLAIFPNRSEEWQIAFIALAKQEPSQVYGYTKKLVSAVIREGEKDYVCDHGGLIEFLGLSVGLPYIDSKLRFLKESPAEKLLARLNTYLELKSCDDALESHNGGINHLFPLSAPQLEAITQLRDLVIGRLDKLRSHE